MGGRQELSGPEAQTQKRKQNARNPKTRFGVVATHMCTHHLFTRRDPFDTSYLFCPYLGATRVELVKGAHAHTKVWHLWVAISHTQKPK